MINNYGYFSNDWKEYIVSTANTPRHWYNYMWNNSFLTIFSQTAQGKALMQDEMGFRTNLISSRMVYIIDENDNKLYNLNGFPVEENQQDYKCIHGMGYSTIISNKNEINSKYTVFVPQNDNCELWKINLCNTSTNEKRFKLVLFFDSSIYGAHEGSFPAAHAWFDKNAQAVVGTNVVRFGSHFSHETTGRTEDGFFTIDSEISAFDTCRRKFIGEYGSLQKPVALVNGGCTNSNCEFEQIVFALETCVTLKPGETKSFKTIAGVVKETEKIKSLKKKYFEDSDFEYHLDIVKEHCIQEINTISIDSPDKELNLFFNGWLKHQLNFNSIWARVYFNGYRDLCQDAENMTCINPNRAIERFRKVLSYQFESGYAPRAWGQGEIIDQDYADSPVWIVFTTYAILKETGDLNFLNEVVPFYKGAFGTVYEHMKRAVYYLMNDRGSHGLSKIHMGDWNDVMNYVGKEGKGESVWLSMALYKALIQFKEIAILFGKIKDSEEANAWASELSENIDLFGWDGEYYLRAYTDKGVPVGSRSSEEGKLFLNTQSWAAISGVAKDDKAEKAMQVVDKYLENDIGVSTLHGLFTGYKSDIGFISAIRPGENLNGGVYLHANLFKVVADCILKRSEESYRTISRILPYSKSRNVVSGEPYVMPNSYFGPESGYRYGEAGASWITGTSGWMVHAIVYHIFGLQPEIEGLKIKPCLPLEWNNCSIIRPFRKDIYNINFIREGESLSNRVTKIIMDEVEIESDIIPYKGGGIHKVLVYLN